MSDIASTSEQEATDGGPTLQATASLPDPPSTGDALVDSILTEFVVKAADSDDLSVQIEGATNAHRQLQARLSVDREH